MDRKQVKLKVGRRCQTPQVRDIPEDQAVRVCVSLCVGMFIHMFLQVSPASCVCEWISFYPQHCGILGCVCVFGCVGRREASEYRGVGVCLCGLLMEVSNHPGLVEIHQDTLGVSGQSSGWITRVKNNTSIKSCTGDISGFVSIFVKEQKKAPVFDFLCSSVVAVPCTGSLSSASNSFQDEVQEFRAWVWYLVRLC